MAAVLVVIALGIAATTLRPVEPDEILFLRALDHFDVFSHSPQAPGYPAFVAAADALRPFAGAPYAATCLVSLLSGLATLFFVAHLARQAGARRWASWVSAVVLGCTPAFAFHSSLGLSDVPGVAALLAAELILLRSARFPPLAPLGGALAAIAVGVRPQLALALLPTICYVLIAVVRQREWRSLLMTGALASVVTLACWVPPVLATGPTRFLTAVRYQREYLLHVDSRLALPYIALHDAIYAWVARPLGGWWPAAMFGLLALSGFLLLARGPRRREAIVLLLGAGLYLTVGMVTMKASVGPRYVLPVLAILCTFVAGIASPQARHARRIGAAAVLLWSGAAVIWAAPVYLDRLSASPAWSAIEWTRANATGRVIVADGRMTPAVRYVLGPAGFEVLEGDSGLASRSDAVFITARQGTPGKVLYERRWTHDRTTLLTTDAPSYCAVIEPPASTTPTTVRMRLGKPGRLLRTEGLTYESGSWVTTGNALFRLPETEPPRVLRIRALDTFHLVGPGGVDELVHAGSETEAIVWPGPGGGLGIVGALGSRFSTVELPLSDQAAPAAFGTAFLLPECAHLTGALGSEWRTDLFVANPETIPIRLLAQFLATDRGSSRPSGLAFDVGPGEVLETEDVLGRAEFLERGASGALLIRPLDPSAARFAVFARTYDRRASAGGPEWAGGQPGRPLAEGLPAGTSAVVEGVRAGAEDRLNVGAVCLSPRSTRVSFVVSENHRIVATEQVWVPPFGHVQTRLLCRVLDARIEITLHGGDRKALAYPYVSIVSNATGLARSLIPLVTGRPTATITPVLPSIQPRTQLEPAAVNR